LLTGLKTIDWIINSQYFSKIIQKCFVCAITLYLTTIGYWMITNHPNQNIFFSSLAGKDWNTKVDVDYWGLSTRQALEAIARIDNRPKILIYAGSIMSLNDSLKILAPEIRARFEVTSNLDAANYIITNYRNELTDYSKPPYSYELVYEIRSGDEKIISTFKNPKTYSQLEGYSAGDVISYARDTPGAKLLGSGWAYPEDWGTWSDGIMANLVIPIKNQSPKLIEVRFKPYLPNKGAKQIFIICLAQNNCKKIQTSNEGINRIQFNLPNKNEVKSIDIAFIFDTPLKPSEHGNLEDNRALAIGLISVAVK
jgi:hypothetical protein